MILLCLVRDSNKGGSPYGELQPFGERLQSPWATSVSEAIAHDSAPENPVNTLCCDERKHELPFL